VNLAAIVLAAGSARRFGSDKLSARFRGEPLVHHAIRAARAAPVEQVVVVCGERLDIGDWPGSPRVTDLRVASSALSESLKAGLAATGAADGVFVFLGDMPLIPHGVAALLAARLDGHFAVVPRYGGANGHPVLLSRSAFAQAAKLSGDEGAGRLLRQRPDVVFVDLAEEAILLDVDCAEDLTRLETRG
jgi:molybdenum cofactor cytidylyltransferase